MEGWKLDLKTSVILITWKVPRSFSACCCTTSHQSFIGLYLMNSGKTQWRIKKQECFRWEGNYAESSVIITCHMEEIVPLKQRAQLHMIYAYLHPHIPPVHPFFVTFFSLVCFLKACIFSSLFTCQFLRPQSFYWVVQEYKWNPHALLTDIKIHSIWGLWKLLPPRRCQGPVSVSMQTEQSS